MPANPVVYYKQNRLKQLRAFCYAAKLGSISKAADKLFLSQPSVSLQIQALERELKTTLHKYFPKRSYGIVMRTGKYISIRLNGSSR